MKIEVVNIDNHDLYKHILNNLYEGVYFVDLNRKILFWNEAAEKITGYTSDEVLDTHCYDNILVHVDEFGNHLCTGICPLLRTMTTGEGSDMKVFLHHKNGHRVPVAVKTIPVKNMGTGNVEGGIEIFKPFESVSNHEKKIEELENLALRDELCQIPNRRYLGDKLLLFLEMYKRFDLSFAILFVDIDHFKRINDTYSHETGDRVLKMVSSTLFNNLRVNDIVARWGGEEFIICLNGIKIDEITVAAERIRMLVENSFITEGELSINVTISIGATMARKDDTLEKLLKRADELLYESKRNGRNRVTFG